MSCLTGKPRYRDKNAVLYALPIRQRRDTNVRECGSCSGWHHVDRGQRT